MYGVILNDFYGLLKTPPKVCTQEGTKHLFEMSSDTILQPHQEIKQKMHTRDNSFYSQIQSVNV